MTVREALTRAASQLAAHPELAPTAVADATLLMMTALGTDRAGLLAWPERDVKREQQAEIQRLLNRRLAAEPMQYILRTREFFGMELKVSPAVLIPRPETEVLVEAVLARVPHDRPLRVVDVGTGSGAIALALARALPLAEIVGVDISTDALAVAQENAVASGLEDRVRLQVGDLLEGAGGGFDAVVSNPPYIAQSERDTLHAQVREYEPAGALFAGATGLEIYERLIPQAWAALKPGGLLALEMGQGQHDAIAALLAAWDAVEMLPDLQGIVRVALARRPK